MYEQGMTPKIGADAYAALYEVEYATLITNEDLVQAWAEIESALTNLYQLSELIQRLISSSFLMTQRTLQYQYNGPKKLDSKMG